MSSTDITEQLRRIIAEQLDVNISYAEIREDQPLFEGGLGLDSVAIMEFIALIEEQFGFEFDEDELNLKPFANLLALTDFVAGKLAAAEGAAPAPERTANHA